MSYRGYSSRSYNLRPRSGGAPPAVYVQPTSSGYQPPDQPPAVVNSNQFAVLDTNINAAVSTLDAIGPLIDQAKPDTPFQLTVCNALRLIVAQLKEIKLGQIQLGQNVDRSFSQVDVDMLDMTRQVVKTEQYNRRDMVTVVGLEKPSGETETSLTEKVAEHLSASGEEVKPADLTAVHRNGKESRMIKGKTIPPTVTVKFSKISKKDTVLKQYRNFDSAKNAPRPVKVYQSLSYHYSELRRYIVKFFGEDNASDNLGLKLKWVTFQSPSSGLAVKLKKDDIYFNGIHVFDDFLSKFAKLAK